MDIHRATNTEHNSQSSKKIGKTENSNSRNLNTKMVRQPRFVTLLKGEVRTGDKERMTAFGSCVVSRAADNTGAIKRTWDKRNNKTVTSKTKKINVNVEGSSR
jgi:hypothetical protein